MIDLGTLIVIGAIFGIIGGVAHQYIDSEQPNTSKDISRGVAIGLVAGLIVALTHTSADIGTIMLEALLAGLSGDFIVLNAIRRRRKKLR